MSPVGDGFTPIRNGLLEHLRDGRLTLLEFAVYILLHMRADWSTGIYRGCALTLAYQAGHPGAKEQIKHTLSRLKKKRYINYPPGVGKRGGYDVLIHKFEPRDGARSGTRLDAWKHGEKCVPEYEKVTGSCPERARRAPADGPEGAPTKEIRSKNEEELRRDDCKTRTTEELKAMKKIMEQGTGKPAREELLQELAAREGIADAERAWQEVVAVLATKINQHTFETWIKPARALGVEGDALVISVPRPEFAQMLERHREQMVAAMRAVGVPYSGVRFRTMVPQIHAADENTGPGKAGRVLVWAALVAYGAYERSIFRASSSRSAVCCLMPRRSPANMASPRWQM